MDLDELRAFVAVVGAGSFKSAATTLGIPRGTLRRRVDALEHRVGVALLERGREGVATTAPGARLAEYGEKMARDADTLMATLRGLASQGRVLRIGLPLGMPLEGLFQLTSFGNRWLPHLDVELRFAEDPVRDLHASVDVMFGFGRGQPGPGLIARPVVNFRMGLRASQAYLRRRGTPQTLEELADHDLLSWVAPEFDAKRWPLSAGGQVEVAPRLATSNFQLLRRMATRDAGIALIPDINLPALDPESETLVPVLPELVGGHHRFQLVVAEGRLHNAAVRTLTGVLGRLVPMMVPDHAIVWN